MKRELHGKWKWLKMFRESGLDPCDKLQRDPDLPLTAIGHEEPQNEVNQDSCSTAQKSKDGINNAYIGDIPTEIFCKSCAYTGNLLIG